MKQISDLLTEIPDLAREALRRTEWTEAIL